MHKQNHLPRKYFGLQIKDLLLVSVLMLMLLIAVFGLLPEKDKAVTSANGASLLEEKVAALLQTIDGVGTAEVMIHETEDGVQGVVVVCQGANDLQVIMDVRTAVATAVGTSEKMVKIYLKKE